ncbi:site-specific integrase [Malikia granosa]|uniref:Tyr recombinase domain-containing protein n=1 Tax=Malikia granosa TaxID=263067 RepID=A0A2S9K8M2_9BURK|nr:site-specific integrase [Malikia granosa]PRD66757.1 hypothetical protein C6P64_02710 [Malikia granosa]
MSIKAPSRLYHRPGTNRFHWRAAIPTDLQAYTQRTEIRLSLHEESRADAIAKASQLNADLPRLFDELRRTKRMTNEPLPKNYFQIWRDTMVENAKYRQRIERLEQQNADLELDAFKLRQQLAGMVDRDQAQAALKQAHTLGQLKGHETLAESISTVRSPEKTALFSELGKAYLASFNARLQQSKKRPPSEKAREKYEKDIELFVNVMGDIRIGAIDKELVGGYCQVLKKLPANMNRVEKYRGKTIDQILAMNPEPQSEVTISGKLGTLSSMFKWALEEKRKWGIDANPFVGFALKDSNKTVRRPFTNEEMLALLNHSTFTTRRFRTTYGYWLIPLAIFTGARLGELCQLDLKDFITVDGIDCIDINDESENKAIRKRLKTDNAKRLVPIHPELVRLGLLRYVAKLRVEKQVHLFPELSRDRRDGPAQAASNWFQKFRARVGVAEKQKTVFHSFRHLFITNLLDQGISPHMVAPIVGHEPGIITASVYWNTKDSSKRKPTVEAFQLSADLLALIPPVESAILPKAKLNTNPPRKKT